MKLWLYVLVVCLLLTGLKGTTVTPPESLSEYLWQETANLHATALNSPFIQGLKTASLDPSKFGAYMVQDSVYCYRAKESIDVAAARTTNPSLQAFLKARSKSYDSYYKSLFNEWRISDQSGIRLGSACADYVNHLNNVATTLDPVYLVAALIPCARLWPWIGKQIIVPKTKNFGVYNKWVRENLNPDSKGFEKYEKVINDAFGEGHIDRQRALEVYTRSMQGEAAFFSSV